MKKCLLGLALLVYLAGTFRYGIFEVLHTLSHQLAGEHADHSHYTEHGTDHQHSILDISKIAFKNHRDAPISQDRSTKYSFDKILHETIPLTLQSALVGLENRQILLFDLQLPPSPVLQTATPPPDNSIPYRTAAFIL